MAKPGIQPELFSLSPAPGQVAAPPEPEPAIREVYARSYLELRGMAGPGGRVFCIRRLRGGYYAGVLWPAEEDSHAV